MYPLLALIDVLFWLSSWMFFNWWIAIFANSDGWLPSQLKWFQTFDAPLDAGWRDGYRSYQQPVGPFSRFWQRTKWLYRNSAYGFSYWALGRKFDPAQWE